MRFEGDPVGRPGHAAANAVGRGPDGLRRARRRTPPSDQGNAANRPGNAANAAERPWEPPPNAAERPRDANNPPTDPGTERPTHDQRNHERRPMVERDRRLAER
jgi:hypothetical protein